MPEQPSPSADAASGTAGSGKPNKRGRRKWYLLGLAALFVIAAIAYGLYYFLVAQFYATTNDAYVHGNRILLAPQRAGTVTAIRADDTDRVHAGDNVIELDETVVDNRLKQASAALAATVRHVHQLFAMAGTQQATIKLRETALEQARRDYRRDARLVKAHAVTEEAFEHSRSTFNEAQSKLNEARARLTEIKAQTNGTTLRNHPQVQQAASAVRAAYLDVRRSHVLAPVSGYIAQRDVQLGQRVDPSQSMLSIVPVDQVWVNANFKETQLAAMRIGQPALVIADFYGGDVVYHGHVAGLSPGTGAAFELLPPQNATGNWIKIVRRLPVRIVLDSEDLKKHPLRLGLSMDVSVNLHDTSGKQLATQQPKKARYQTHVYDQRAHGAARIIDRIIAVNDGDPDTQPETSTAANARLPPQP